MFEAQDYQKGMLAYHQSSYPQPYQLSLRQTKTLE
jgi:hypothetical protein